MTQRQWSYGVTTTPERRYTHLPKTLQSLKESGFTDPVLFVDATGSIYPFSKCHGLLTVRRAAKIGAWGNWLLGLMELWIRNPGPRMFAMFQDDLLVCRNLLSYLAQHELSDNAYWNLYTWKENEKLRPSPNYVGWYPSNQIGRGALALVFNHNVAFKLLTAHSVLAKSWAPKNPDRSIDGTVASAMRAVGTTEYVHYPSLVKHTGTVSTLVKGYDMAPHEPESWQGQEFDALSLLEA